MSVTGRGAVGIPTCLLYEGEGYTITVETKSGEIYRGFLQEGEDNMNVLLKNVKYTNLNGQVSSLDQVYLRGTKIKFIVFPDILAQSPMFKRVAKFKASKGRYVPQGAGTERAGRRVDSRKPEERGGNHDGRAPYGQRR